MLKLLKNRLPLVGLLIGIVLLSGIVTAAITISNNAGVAQESQLTTVELYEEFATPDTITLQVGEQLRIANRSSSPRELSLGAGEANSHHDKRADEHQTKDHEHTHEHKSGFTTGIFASDEAWVGSFSEPGTYFLHDHDRPEINILVVVY